MSLNLALDFESAWKRWLTGLGARPDPAALLAAAGEDPVSSPDCLELALIDLEHRLKWGESAHIDDYLEMFPALRNDREAIQELVRAEYRFTLFQGDDPALGSYRARFPAECDDALLAELETLRRDPENDPQRPRFRVIRFHRRGGLGEVFEAYDRQLRRRVALKAIRDDHPDQFRSRSRFVREAEITGRLQHPGIVSVFSLDRDDVGRPFYAMRFVEGDLNLSDAIRQLYQAGPAVEAAGAWGREFRGLLTRLIAACEAVAYAHSRGVLHRDLKPSNILLGPFGETLVVDWGLAKVIDRTGQDAGAREGTFPPATVGPGDQSLQGSADGTPQFMSPEQADAVAGDLGPASDIYSLGATLYNILTGHPPFTPESRDAILKKVRDGSFSRPRAIRSGVPRALEAVCLKAMAREPGGRYADARDLAADLERWLAGEPVSAWREPWTTRFRRWAVRHRTATTAAAAALLVASLGAGYRVYEARLRDARDFTQRLTRAEGRVEGLKSAETREVTALLELLRPDRHLVQGRLLAMTRPGVADRARLHASLALLQDDPSQAGYLVDRLLGGAPDEVLVVREALWRAGQSTRLSPRLWALLENAGGLDEVRFRAAAALARFDPDGRQMAHGYDLRLMSSTDGFSSIPTGGKCLVIVADVNNMLVFRIFDDKGKTVVFPDEYQLKEQAPQIKDLRKQLESLWPPHNLTRSETGQVIGAVTSIVGHIRWSTPARLVSGHLVRENPLLIPAWGEAFLPVRRHLRTSLQEIYSGQGQPTERASAYALLFNFAVHDGPDQPGSLAELVADADPAQFRQLVDQLRRPADRLPAVAALCTVLPLEAVLDSEARVQGQVAAVLVALGYADRAWPVFRFGAVAYDPEAREASHREHNLRGSFIEYVVNNRWPSSQEPPSDAARRALVLSLGELSPEAFSEARRVVDAAVLLDAYRSEGDAGLHSALDWLLRQRCGLAQEIVRIDQDLAGRPLPEGRNWYASSQGGTLAIIRSPADPRANSFDRDLDPGGRLGERPARRWVGDPFAIATHPVTVGQYKRFLEATPEITHIYNQPMPFSRNPLDRPPDEPMDCVTWYDAARYCNWLSRQEGIPPDQWYYSDEPGGSPHPHGDEPTRTGYRLPTEAEWSFVCGTLTEAQRPFGKAGDPWLAHGAWFWRYAVGRKLHAVGRSRPNDLGLFDLSDNALEWTGDSYGAEDPGLRRHRSPPRGLPGSAFPVGSQGRIVAVIPFHDPAMERNSLSGGLGFRVARAWR